MNGFWLRLLLLGLLLGGERMATGQDLKDLKELKDIIGPRVYAAPSVRGMGRSKGLIVRYEGLPGYRIYSRSPDREVGGASAKVRQNNQLDLRLYVPVLNKSSLKAVMGFQYATERHLFENGEQYPFYATLHDKRLRILGVQGVVLHSFGDHNYAVVRLKGSLNGDFPNLRSIRAWRYMRYSLEAVYGWQPNPTFSYGLAVQVSHNYGRTSLLPAIMFNRTFSEKWGIESVFPAQVLFRRNVSARTLLYAGYGGESVRYNMQTPPSFAGVDSLQLRRINLRVRLRWEQEIYDFLWFGLESGLQANLRHRALSDFSLGSRHALIFSRTQPVPYLRAEVFLVPPRRFSRKK